MPPRNLDAIPNREETGQNLPMVEEDIEVLLKKEEKDYIRGEIKLN